MQSMVGKGLRITVFGALVVPAAALGACSGGSAGTPATGSVSDPVTSVKTVPQPSNPYTLFETLQVRPLAISPDGQFLYAANTPDNRLEVFRIQGHSLQPLGSVITGLEPVAVAVRSNGEVWVVNHLSDSVSIVHVDVLGIPRVINTLLVGDEPRDIVFAGPAQSRAFITTAHRGQDSPDDPDLFNNVGRADVWVFDANNPGTGGGTRLTKIVLFADTPRALAASADGTTVYAAAFLSGNQTTSVSEDAVNQVYPPPPGYPTGMPGPAFIAIGGQIVPQPTTGLVVKWKVGRDGNTHWIDAYGTIFDPFVKVTLPDQDVFAIDATANPPVQKAAFAHVGTTLFNMAVNPKNGKVYVSNTDAHNDVRFEGHTPGFSSVVGNITDSRISVVDPIANTVTSNNLNSHLTHSQGTASTGSGDATLSLAFPEGLAVTGDGKSLYVIAQGSAKLAIYDTGSLEAGSSPQPTQAGQVLLSGGGPTGLALDEQAGLAFVLTRFDDGISIVDTGARKEIGHVQMFSPEPASVTAGRQYLYNATLTSALGDQACASCHIGGDLDGLAWDLGNPGGIPLPITQPAPGYPVYPFQPPPTPAQLAQEAVTRTVPEYDVEVLVGTQQAEYVFSYYQPVKGPMTTQSLRGLDNHGAMHWRGDRNGSIQQNGAPFLDGSGNPVVSAQPNSGIFDEFNAFKSFNVAFPGLVGNSAQLSDADMSDFTNFILQVTYPPNPVRNLDNSLTPTQQAGQAFFFNQAPDGTELPVDRFHDCNGCHTLDRNGNAGGTAHPGFFGTSGRLTFENEPQLFKVPHLRNAYQKLGMYASSPDSILNVASVTPLNQPAVSVRGFGYLHNGEISSIEQFLTPLSFLQTFVTVNLGTIQNVPPNPYGIPFFNDPNDPLNPAANCPPGVPFCLSQEGLALRRAISSYALAFDTNLFPIVGKQITLTQDDSAAVAARIALLEAQATAGQTDLVAHATYLLRTHGFTFSGGMWTPDVSWLPPLTDAQLRSLAVFGAVTFTAVPPGEGWRVGVDRDGDGYVDGDELAAGTNPSNPASHP
jgi:DNA-binding beta-propeller fold protein YncE